MSLLAGIDVGGSSIKYGLVDRQGGVLFVGRTTTPDTAEHFLARIDTLWRTLTARAQEPLAAVGLGLPGLFQSRSQTIIQSPHCPYLNEFDLLPPPG